MKTHDAIARILAFHQGCPLPSGATLPFRRVASEHKLLVAFVTLGGETAPWGVIYGLAGQTPRICTTPDPRNHDAVARMLVPFAQALLEHLPHPSMVDRTTERVVDTSLQRQLWLPGRGHVDMLHLLDYRLSKSKYDGPGALDVKACGRACGELFRTVAREGQQRVFDATQTLQALYTFPSDEAHLLHLGYLLAWLETRGSREDRMAAAAIAEDEAVDTTMHPSFEAAHLMPLLDAYAKLDESSPEALAKARQLSNHLSTELRRRWALLDRAVSWLDADARPSTPGLEALDEHALYNFRRFWEDECKRLRGDSDSYDVHPETDGQLGAAYGYFSQQRAQDEVRQVMLHGDPQRLDEAIAEGDAFRGVITAAQRVGSKRSQRTVWRVESNQTTPLRLREGGTLCVAGASKMLLLLRSIETRQGVRTLTVEVFAQYKAGHDIGLPTASDVDAIVGHSVTLVPAPTAGITVARTIRFSQQGPGDWLTSKYPEVPPSRAPAHQSELLAIVEGLRRTDS